MPTCLKRLPIIVIGKVVKGAPVEVFGKLRDASYVAKDGQQKSAVEIVADAILVHEKEKPEPPINAKFPRPEDYGR